ncbi:MAG TPA: hypothetical protein VEC39_15955 [Vicinamibacterales bacterium]|nr:hypothetical protein [Vicinamibacterales bacterium]
MRLIRLLGVLFAAFSVTACLNSTTLVKLKPDGSGTVEQTTLVNVAALKGVMGAGPAQANQGPMMNKADLERTAQRMGKGVRLVSAEPIKGANGFEGTKAIFSFDDINQVQISQDPNLSGSTDNMMAAGKTEDPVKFKLTRGGTTSTLTIEFADRPVGDAKPSSGAAAGEMPDLTNPMIMSMIKTMFNGFKVNIDLEVVGSIVKTNAEYVSGPRITLLEMDMAALLADEAKLKALQSKIGPGASFSDVKPLLKDVKGIKIDGPSISVEFR